MKRCVMSLLLLALATVQAEANFIWIIPGKPEAEKTTAQVIFSDSLQPDSPDLMAKIANTELFVRTTGDQRLVHGLREGEAKVTLAGKGPATVGGVCQYGVIQRGKADPFLLASYPKTLIGSAPSESPHFRKAWRSSRTGKIAAGEGPWQGYVPRPVARQAAG